MRNSKNKMKLLMTSTTILISVLSKGQLIQSTWLAGGSATFYSRNENNAGGSNSLTSTYLQLAPMVGYFFADKLAAGLMPSYTYNALNTSNSVSSKGFGIGPFIRYYLLEKEKNFNILAQGSYQYSFIQNATNSANTYTLSAGPVLFFNSAVALEFPISYSIRSDSDADKAKTFQIGVGFQVHLK